MKTIATILMQLCCRFLISDFRFPIYGSATPLTGKGLVYILLIGTLVTASANEVDVDATYFHPAASMYIHGDTPGASNLVVQGLSLHPNNGKLKRLKELLEKEQEQQKQDDQQQNEDQQKDENDQQQDQQQQDQDQKNQDQQEEQQQKKQPEPQSAEQMSPDEAEHLLDAMKQEEENKRLQLHPVMGRPVKVDKDW